MAKLIPSIEPEDIHNDGESKVARELIEQLPDNVIAIHSFNWVRPRASGVLTEGECDFVVLDPRSGILVVEVKGGILKYDADLDIWKRFVPRGEWRPLDKSPFKQVSSNMYCIVARIKESLGNEELPCSYGYALMHPDGDYSGPLPADAEDELVIDARKLKDLDGAIKAAFRRWRRHRAPLGKDDLERIKRILLPAYSVSPVLWRTIEDQERKIHRLTDEQRNMLDILSQRQKAVIEGGAGTGKTMLAIAKAQECAAAGMRVLLLCFNRALKESLIQDVSDEFRERLEIHTYHSLVMKSCNLAKIRFGTTGDSASQASPDLGRLPAEFWNSQAPIQLMEASERLAPEHKFDAVIVDEGQDFRSDWWASLDSVFKDPDDKKCFFVFLDPNQDLFGVESELPDEIASERFPLSVNCRNTINIASYCADLIDGETTTRPYSPVGVEPEKIRAQTLDEAMRTIGAKIRKLCATDKDGLRESQIALLAPRKTSAAWPERFKTVRATQDIDAWRENKGVLITTPHVFKGLESDVVIAMTKPFSAQDARASKENYVSCSRAKHVLIVVEVADLA